MEKERLEGEREDESESADGAFSSSQFLVSVYSQVDRRERSILWRHTRHAGVREEGEGNVSQPQRRPGLREFER